MRPSLLDILYEHSPQMLHNKHILLVGVGGIGCEVLKCLYKETLASIHILDLDTIEISNLNRQFLFRPEHRGQSKAFTARDTILQINPQLNIHAHHCNVKEMGADFFRQFDLVIMALDNTEARSFVNEACVLFDIPIIDAGTSGYNGQVQFIRPKVTPCFGCEVRENSQKVFQVCTIRTRPDKPIHCITWAKFFFEAIFGPENQGNDLNDITQLGNELKKQPSLNKVNEFVCQIFYKEIKALLSDSTRLINWISEEDLSFYTKVGIQNLSETLLTTVQSPSFYTNTLKESLLSLLEMSQTLPIIPFEKDDDVIMNFIVASANLRMHIFSIPMMTYYAIKQTAGNIIPAIASTNSIVSGVQITEALKHFSHEESKLRYTYLLTGSRKLGASVLSKPNPECLICSAKYRPVIVFKNFEALTLGYLVDLVKMHKPDLSFSINIKGTTKDSKELNELMNSQDYNQKNYSQQHLKKSISHFDRERKIIRVFVSNEDNGNLVCYLYLVDNPDAPPNEEQLDLQGFVNQEVPMESNKNTSQQTQYKIHEYNGKKEIALDDSCDSDSDSLEVVIQAKSGPLKRVLEESNACQSSGMKRIRLE